MADIDFATLDDVDIYADQYIIENHNNEIQAIQHNNVDLGLSKFIRRSHENWDRATVRTTAGSYIPTSEECVLVFRSAATGTITLTNNRWNEWVIDNQTGSPKQLIGSVISSYWNPNGVQTNFVPSQSCVRIAKGKDNNWYQIDNLKSTGGTVLKPLMLIVGEDGAPVENESTWQNDSLIGVGVTNNGRVMFSIDTIPMINFGNSTNFTFNTETGEVNISPSVWVAESAIVFDLNQ